MPSNEVVHYSRYFFHLFTLSDRQLKLVMYVPIVNYNLKLYWFDFNKG